MLNEEQKQKVSAWIADGVKLSDIQNRLGEEYAVRLTYMEVRLLVDDLKLTPKDPVLPEPPAPAPTPAPEAPTMEEVAPPPAAEGTGKITLSTDAIPKPGTAVSGTVTFSDGKTAGWYLDQTGRLGVVPEEQGYRPPAGDVPEFQAQLDQMLSQMGF